jgi:hypothetical protein
MLDARFENGSTLSTGTSPTSTTHTENTATNEKDYDIQTIDEIVLGPLETKKICLAITSKKTGTLHISGFKYLLFNQAPSKRKFVEEVNGILQEYTLVVTIMNRMPILDVMFHAVPDVLISGEVVRCVIQITNQGRIDMSRLAVKLSHPSFMFIGLGDQVEFPPYAFKEKEKSGDDEDIVIEGGFEMNNNLIDPSVKFLELGVENQDLEPNGTVLLPLWIRGDRMGKHKLRVLFAYQSKEDETSWRTFRHKINLNVYETEC